MRDDDLAAWVTLARAPALNRETLTRALSLTGASPRDLLRCGDSTQAQAGLSAHTRAYLSSPAAKLSRREAAWLDSPRHHLLPFTDARYPRQLLTVARAPIALYVAGRAEALHDPQIAIVGSRNPTPAGREIAHDFAASLAGCGLAITSGLAAGIDSAAHAGALRGQGLTFAVLGSGVDVVYPRGNRGLSEDIQGAGALLSEFALGTPPRPENFPRRNRIIATLSLGTLVVEAALRSGSLITARIAGDHNRELFAVPGSIHSPLSRGCHQLIRDGAKLTETTADILSELKFSLHGIDANSSAASTSATALAGAGMDKDGEILLDALGFDPTDVDSLVVRTGLKADAVCSMLIILELEGRVQAAPGGRFCRAVRSRR